MSQEAASIRTKYFNPIGVVSFLGSLIAAVAGVIVFVFMTFQTKEESDKDRSHIERNISDLKTDLREINQKLDRIIEDRRR